MRKMKLYQIEADPCCTSCRIGIRFFYPCETVLVRYLNWVASARIGRVGRTNYRPISLLNINFCLWLPWWLSRGCLPPCMMQLNPKFDWCNLATKVDHTFERPLIGVGPQAQEVDVVCAALLYCCCLGNQQARSRNGQRAEMHQMPIRRTSALVRLVLGHGRNHNAVFQAQRPELDGRE